MSFGRGETRGCRGSCGVAVAAIAARSRRRGRLARRSLTVTDADVGLRLAKDASLIVRETLTSRYEGSYNAILPRHPAGPGGDDQHGPGERLEGGRVYSPGGCTTFGLHRRGRQVRRHADSGRFWRPDRLAPGRQRRAADLHGHLPGGRAAPRDRLRRRDRRLLAGLGRPVGLQPRPSDRRISGILPSAPTRARTGPSNPSAVWGHPREVEGRDFLENGVAGLEASDIPAHQFVELRVLVPRTAGQGVSAAGKGEGSGLQKVTAEEQGVDRRLQLALEQDQALRRPPRGAARRHRHGPAAPGARADALAGPRASDLGAGVPARAARRRQPRPRLRARPRGRGQRGHRARDPARPGRARLLRHEAGDHRGREAGPRHHEGGQAARGRSSSRTSRRCSTSSTS